jgi:hypothetical protein
MWRGVLTGVLLLCVLPELADAQQPGLKVVKPSELALTRENGDSSTGSVWIRNSSADPLTPRFGADVEEGDGANARLRVVTADDSGNELRTAPAVDAGDIRRYRLFLRSPPKQEPQDVSGVLVVRGGSVPGSIPLSVSKKAFADLGVTGTLLWPLVPAALLILVAGIIATAGKTTTLRSRLPPDLDFKTSFASTVTAAGAVLATVIAAAVLPEQTAGISKEAFVALNLIFGVGVVVAGLVYAALQAPVWVDVQGSENPVKQQCKMEGRVWGFLAASFVTVWAVFGELLTVWLLIYELGQDQGFSDVSLAVFKILILATACTMVLYTCQRIRAIVASERNKPAEMKGRHKPHIDTTAQPMQSVSML